MGQENEPRAADAPCNSTTTPSPPRVHRVPSAVPGRRLWRLLAAVRRARRRRAARPVRRLRRRLTGPARRVAVAMNLIVENIRDRLRSGTSAQPAGGGAAVRRRNISDSQLFVTPH